MVIYGCRGLNFTSILQEKHSYILFHLAEKKLTDQFFRIFYGLFLLDNISHLQTAKLHLTISSLIKCLGTIILSDSCNTAVALMFSASIIILFNLFYGILYFRIQ